MAEQTQASDNNEQQQPQQAAEDLYRAEYVGSGTFLIKKPKRKNEKKHLSRVRNPQRRARRVG